MTQTFKLKNKHQILVFLLIPLLFNSCNIIRYIGGDKRWIKHDVGLETSTDSILKPQVLTYTNKEILEKEKGVYYVIETEDSIQTQLIHWNNKWHTIIVNDTIQSRKVFYTFDRKNRLRIINYYSNGCNCYSCRYELNKRGKVISLERRRVSF